ncbi:MAG: CHAD domain-containing protein, partial [Actinomycetota bacterium]|nr:CHAD domain-containing protein [Actinomycetota bacterium]
MNTIPTAPVTDPEPSLLRFVRGETIAEGLDRVLAIQFDIGLALGAATRPEQAAAVHATRKAIKRLRSMLRLVRDQLPDVVYYPDNATLRLVAAELGSIRDSWVMANTLDQLVTDDPDLSHAAAALTERLTHRYEAESQTLLENEASIASIVERLGNVKSRSARWTVVAGTADTPLPHEFASIGPGLLRVYKRSRQGMKIVTHSPTITLLHAWRKRAKYLRHQIEALNVLDPPGLAPIEADLELLTDLLGDDHDLAVMGARLNSDGPLTRGIELDLILDAVGDKRFRLQAEAAELGSALFTNPASGFLDHIGGLWVYAPDSSERVAIPPQT